MVNTGLHEKTIAASPALELLTPIWNSTMLNITLIIPRTAIYPQSDVVRCTCLLSKSFTASGSKSNPPIKKRRKVS